MSPQQCIKTLLVRGADGLVALCLRGDHEINEVKAGKLAELPGESVLASEEEILAATGARPGFIGPVGLPDVDPGHRRPQRRRAGRLRLRRQSATAPTTRGANWERDARITRIADMRNVVEGDPSPDGEGTLQIARGIEVGHVFQLGQKYAEAMGATVLDDQGKAQSMHMGCYGIGVSRIVAAAIEQSHDDAGILWPEAMAPWRVAVCVINPRRTPRSRDGAEALYQELARARHRGGARRSRPAPGADVCRHGTDRHSAPRRGQRTRTGRRNPRIPRRDEAENRAVTRDELLDAAGELKPVQAAVSRGADWRSRASPQNIDSSRDIRRHRERRPVGITGAVDTLPAVSRDYQWRKYPFQPRS